MKPVVWERSTVFAMLACAFLVGSGPAGATPLLAAGEGPVPFGSRESLTTDRPETWAMTWLGSALLATGLAAPAAPAAGSVELGLEAGWLPHLSRAERTVGFAGTKEEDLNRSPGLARLRARVGLPARVALEVGLLPPVELDGVDPRFYSLGLGWTWPEAGPWRGGLRLHTDFGRLRGDLTCPAAAAAAGEDPEANPYFCRARSLDEIRYRIVSFEVTAARAPRRAEVPAPYLALAVHRLDETFQVDALWLDLHDRSRLDATDTTWSLAAGLDGELFARWRWSAELFYSPLSPVERRVGAGSRTDALLNARLALRWRAR